MNRKETISLAIVGMALLATVMTMSSPTQALALGHWNLDEDSTPKSGPAEDGMDSSGTTDNTNGEEEDSASATADNGEEDGSEDGTNSNDKKEDSSHEAYEEFQGCLSGLSGSPTEQQVQDCIESSYSGIDSNEDTPSESTDDGATKMFPLTIDKTMKAKIAKNNHSPVLT